MATEEKRQAQQQLDEQMSKLAIEQAKRAKLEAVQLKLQATIESQRKGDEKKEARKRQQKEPMETAYSMTNMPDDLQGPYKCGKTGGDAKKRAKEMQTGNHEAMRVVASAKCVDSKLVEDVMHRIFWDYRTNDRLEWFDTRLESMKSVMTFIVRTIDGLNSVDHDGFCTAAALKDGMAVMEEKIFKPATQPVSATRVSGNGRDFVDSPGGLAEPAEGNAEDSHIPEPGHLDLDLYVEKYLQLNCDRRDPQHFVFKTPLYNHYVSACIKQQCIPLRNQQFSKAIRDLLEDHYKGGGSNRDQHYVGIGLVNV